MWTWFAIDADTKLVEVNVLNGDPDPIDGPYEGVNPYIIEGDIALPRAKTRQA